VTKAKTKATTRPPYAPPQAAPDDGALALALLARVAPGPSWAAWRALLKGLFALPMSESEAATFQQGTAREILPTSPARECWVVAGRRSGKSRIAGLLVTFLGAVRRWRVAPGERPMVLLLAPSRRQAGVVLSYTESMLAELPGTTVTRRTLDELELSTGVVIRIESASFRTPRGFSIVGVVADEIAFWRDESGAAPDVEILRAVRPPLASVPGSLLIAISSPYSTRGSLHATYEKHFGRADSDTLVWQSDSRTLNPTLPARLIAQAIEDDPASASSEWGGLFRSDLETLYAREALAAVVMPGRYELPPQPGAAHVAFLDPSGGSHDSFGLAIAHKDHHTGKVILDLLREVRAPFSPERTCEQFSRELTRYGCRLAFADSYAAQWPVEQFQKYGVTVQPSPLTRSELFLELLPALNSGAVELLDNARLVGQLAALERRTGRTGRDAVDHPRGGFDDLANAAAGSLVMCSRSIGLKAALPGTFTECVNEIAASRCAFTSAHPWFPSDHGCRQCVGLKAVRGAFQQHQQQAAAANEPMLNAREFLRARFDVESAPLTRRVAWDQLVREYEGHLGL
jgi:hypothetical protein